MTKKKTAALLLSLAMAAQTPCAAAISYTLNDQASEVALIQRALLELDLYYGDVTEHYGPRTQRGVRLFQDEYGLEITGTADEETRALLYEITGITPPEMSDMLIEMDVTLRKGDSGSAVSWLQESLAELSFYEGEITGSFGGLTKEAVRLFQRSRGLSSDGVAGQNTIRVIAMALEEKEQEAIREKLEAEYNMQLDPYQPYQPAAPVTTQDPETITTLKLGVKNSAVRRLQENLTELGFYKGEITGSFGRLTKEAVRLFQRANDLPSDGVAGPMTLAEIEDEMGDLRAPTAAPTAAPTPTPQPTPDRYNGLVQLITPRPAATAAPTATPKPTASPTPTPKPVSGVNSSVGFLNIQKELRLYDSSEEVRQLQLALSSLGYYKGEASGYFDFLTRAAVMGYQAAKGLSVSGDATKVTLITINDDIFRRFAGVED